jgi:hypothetical protein
VSRPAVAGWKDRQEVRKENRVHHGKVCELPTGTRAPRLHAPLGAEKPS